MAATEVANLLHNTWEGLGLLVFLLLMTAFVYLGSKPEARKERAFGALGMVAFTAFYMAFLGPLVAHWFARLGG
jgi:hypothetical protein